MKHPKIFVILRYSKYCAFSACDCGDDPRYSGNCAPGGGQCECKEAFRGAEDCSACADGYYDYPDCKPCDCFANGTVLMENGLPFCVAEGTLQCPCLENFSGAFCDECAEGFFGFPDCNRKFMKDSKSDKLTLNGSKIIFSL